MADPVLHIKDSYYFEVPKVLYPYAYTSRKQFPDVWISLDPDFQKWEADRLYGELQFRDAQLPPKEKLLSDWHDWVHADHSNFAKPLKEFLNAKYDGCLARFAVWKKQRKASSAKAQKQSSAEKTGEADTKAAAEPTFEEFLSNDNSHARTDSAYSPFLRWRHTQKDAFEQAVGEARNIHEWKADSHVSEWNQATLNAYNAHLSGKILIPQPFGTLRNLYQRESGFAISKYMLLEVVIGLVILMVFANLAKKLAKGGPPRGYLWNLLESFLLFIRDDVVSPSIGGHHEEDDAQADTHAAMPKDGHQYGDPYAEHGAIRHEVRQHGSQPHAAHGAPGHEHADDVTRLLPLFWTIFFFVLGCNLFGMIPWLGAPSSSFSVTTGLALVTFVVGIYCGMLKFGVVGHLANQIPGMDLPWYMAIVVKPLVYAIEVLGLMIKHAVLAIRLLANMVAGHLVILGIMSVAFGASAAMMYAEAPSWQWPLAATIAVVASTAFSLLELFVAFLQAYIFTFLSALFIGATLHKH